MDTIPQVLQKIKEHLSGEITVVIIIVLVAVASFGLGRLSMSSVYHEPIRIEYQEAAAKSAALEAISGGMYVASKDGTVYHLPWCSSAQRIAEQNKIWFTSKEEAEAAGYRPARNCNGI